MKEEKPQITYGLLPCPMCGHNMPDMIQHNGTYHVLCKCGLATSLTNKNSVAAAEWNKRIIPEDERNTKARIAELEADVKVWQESVERLREKIEAMRSIADESEKRAFEAGRTTYINKMQSVAFFS